MLHSKCYTEAHVGVGTFIKRADQAVQDTKTSVSTGVMLSVAALVIAVAALVVAVVRR